MNKEYPGSSIEFRAKELLSSIQGSCPDMVWNEVNLALEAKRTKANERWLNKYNTPRVALIVTAVVAITTLATWKFIFAKKNNVTPDTSTYQNPAPSQNIVNTPPVTPAPASITTQPKKDTATAVATSTQPVTNNAITSTTQPVQLALNNANSKTNAIQKSVVQHNNPIPSQPDSTHTKAIKMGAASINASQPDTTFTLHRGVGAPISSGGAAIQDTAIN